MGAELDLTKPQAIHLVGAGGFGLSAMATVLVGLGHRVSGSDQRDSAAVGRLRALGVPVTVGHDAANVPEAVDLVAVSTAIPSDNPEITEARRRGVPVLSRAELLAPITRLRRTISVAGTHGKTTTSSMLATVLGEAGLSPSFIVGGDLLGIGGGAEVGTGEWLVVEADESDGTFLELATEIAVVTSVEPDHLEHWGSFESLVGGFRDFLAGARGPAVVCADDGEAAALAGEVGATTYGTTEGSDYRISDVRVDRVGSAFRVQGPDDQEIGEVWLPAAGIHNVRNATAALVTGLLLGAPWEAMVAALAHYRGVARRFELKGERAGPAGSVTFIDDYAHLPAEVRAALDAARSGGWGRVVCVFQPHRYSRTEALWRDFADAFADADLLVLTDVYGFGEPPRAGVTGELILHAVLDAHPSAAVAYLPRRADLAPYLRKALRAGDVCVTVGAGDITGLAGELLGEDTWRPAR